MKKQLFLASLSLAAFSYTATEKQIASAAQILIDRSGIATDTSDPVAQQIANDPSRVLGSGSAPSPAAKTPGTVPVTTTTTTTHHVPAPGASARQRYSIDLSAGQLSAVAARTGKSVDEVRSILETYPSTVNVAQAIKNVQAGPNTAQESHTLGRLGSKNKKRARRA